MPTTWTKLGGVILSPPPTAPFRTGNAARPRSANNGSAMGFRPEIQGLRAMAVLVVIVHHLRPGALSGGFIGVDMFFVISGYLITAHLFREARDTGRIRLGAFWSRRIRRLLPLAFTVLLASAGLVFALVPATEHGTMFRHIAAAGFYIENWALVADATDYSAAGQMATVVQHFWSLSVEEQFYVAWPLLAVLALWLASRGGRAVNGGVGRHAAPGLNVHRVFLTTIALVAVVSFVYGLWATETSPAAAYFNTGARAWEFAAGGVVALLCLKRGVQGLAGAFLGWAGTIALLAGAVLIPTETRFPGTMALLPVLGTAAVLAAAGSPDSRFRWFSHATWLSIRPARFVGDISYGAYLWHWPLIIVAPFALRAEPKWYHEAGIVVLTLALAWLSYVLIENPFRIGRLLKPVRNALVFAVAGMLVVAGVSVAGFLNL